MVADEDNDDDPRAKMRSHPSLLHPSLAPLPAFLAQVVPVAQASVASHLSLLRSSVASQRRAAALAAAATSDEVPFGASPRVASAPAGGAPAASPSNTVPDGGARGRGGAY